MSTDSATTAPEKFEIRVALIGYVSVGKSTVLNALLGDKFSEVSMRRTTAGVNFFRIAKSDGTPAAKVHETIAADNEALRNANPNRVEERYYDIEIDQPLCTMRDDTDLYLVDIPGLNEAGTSIYWDYVQDNWSTFDCVIVVMDALQGVNTKEQVQLLDAVAKSKKGIKDIPAIILGNKVDHPDNQEQQLLVQEARSKAEQVLGKSCSEANLKSLAKGDGLIGSSVFIPCSASNAYIYRTVAKLTREKFAHFDSTIVDRLGQDEVGRRKWKSMDDDKKYETISSIVNDPESYEECLLSTNFLVFLNALDQFIGGSSAQLNLLQKQIDVTRRSLSFDKSTIDDISKICRISDRLGLKSSGIEEEFWSLYEPKEKLAFAEMELSVDPSPIGLLMQKLIDYFHLASKQKWADEKTKIKAVMKNMVIRHLHIPLGKDPIVVVQNWRDENPSLGKKRKHDEMEQIEVIDDDLDQNTLSPADWSSLISSVLLLSPERHFYESFGPEKIKLEQMLAFYNSAYTVDLASVYATIQQVSTKLAEVQGRLRPQGHFGTLRNPSPTVPEYPDDPSAVFSGKYNASQVFSPENRAANQAMRKLFVPRNLADPSHWGHVVWLYCKFCRENE